MNNTFASKGIPIIINEVGVLTEQKKDRINQRIFVYNISISLYFDGIMPCLQDTSNKGFGDIIFYDRENDA